MFPTEVVDPYAVSKFVGGFLVFCVIYFGLLALYHDYLYNKE